MNFRNAFLLFEVYGLVYCLCGMVWAVIMSEIVPKKMKEKYLGPPYYSKMEAFLFQVYPKKLGLGLQFTAMIVMPRLGKRRGLDKAYLDAPTWWVRLSYAFFWLVYIPCALWLTGAFGLYVYDKLL